MKNDEKHHFLTARIVVILAVLNFIATLIFLYLKYGNVN